MDKYLHYGRSIRSLLDYEEILVYMDMDDLAQFNEHLVRSAAAYTIYMVGRLGTEALDNPFHESRIRYLHQLDRLIHQPQVWRYLQENELTALADAQRFVEHWKIWLQGR